jgi:hypothetical protein
LRKPELKNAMSDNTTSLFKPGDCLPSLLEIIQSAGIDGNVMTVGLRFSEDNRIDIPERHLITLMEDKKFAEWTSPSLREMFRGQKAPPADMNHYPEEYVPVFFYIEKHILTACNAIGDRTDFEMEEIFSMMRRRPDGKSLGPLHNFVWQLGAVALALRPLSQAEFEEVFGQLARSNRHWAQSPSSRNYATYLRQSFGSVQ